MLIRPGSTTCPVASITARPLYPAAISAAGPTATMRLPSTATAPGAITRRAASIVTTVPPVITSETGCSACEPSGAIASPAITAAALTVVRMTQIVGDSPAPGGAPRVI